MRGPASNFTPQRAESLALLATRPLSVAVRPTTMTDAELGTVLVDEYSIAYREAGLGTTLLLLHGFLCDSRCRRQLDGLSDQFRVWRGTHRAQGRLPTLLRRSRRRTMRVASLGSSTR